MGEKVAYHKYLLMRVKPKYNPVRMFWDNCRKQTTALHKAAQSPEGGVGFFLLCAKRKILSGYLKFSFGIANL
jgi:hypothetical protein